MRSGLNLKVWHTMANFLFYYKIEELLELIIIISNLTNKTKIIFRRIE